MKGLVILWLIAVSTQVVTKEFHFSIEGVFLRSTINLQDISDQIYLTETIINGIRYVESDNESDHIIFLENPTKDSVFLKYKRIGQLKNKFRDAISSEMYDQPYPLSYHII